MKEKNIKLKQVTKTRVSLRQLLVLAAILAGGSSIVASFFLVGFFGKFRKNAADDLVNAFLVDNNSAYCQQNPNGGTGTKNDPFCSIQRAFNEPALTAGYTIKVKAGVYRESYENNGIQIPINLHGTPENPITLTSYGNGEVIIDGSKLITQAQISGSGTTKHFTSPVNYPYGLFINDEIKTKVWPCPGATESEVAGYLQDNEWSFCSGTIYYKLPASDLINPKVEVPTTKDALYIEYNTSTANQGKYLKIINMHFRRFYQYGIRDMGINGTVDCHNELGVQLAIKGNTIEYIDDTAIMLSRCPNITITNNVIRYNGIRANNANIHRHQGMLAANESWELIDSANGIYRAAKGNDCGEGRNETCVAGPEIAAFDNTALTYFQPANQNEPAAGLPQGQWTTSDSINYIYFRPTSQQLNSQPLTSHRFTRDVYVNTPGHGIQPKPPVGRVGTFIVSNNQIINNYSKGLVLCNSDSNGACGASVWGSLVYGNTIANNKESGLDNSSGQGISIFNNVIHDNGVTDLEGPEDDGGDKGVQLNGNGMRFHHNVLYNSGNSELSIGSTDNVIFSNTIYKGLRSLDQTPNCSNYGGMLSWFRSYNDPGNNHVTDIAIKNNIFYIAQNGVITGCSLRGAVDCDTNVTNPGNCTDNADWNGNDYFTYEDDKSRSIHIENVSPEDFCVTPDQGGSCSSANFQTGFVNESRTPMVNGTFDSFGSDPLFVNAALGNFALAKGSPMIDKGVPLTYTKTNGATLTASQVPVYDAKYFYDGNTNPNILPDKEKVKINNQTCTINDINYGTDTITCQETITFGDKANVYWGIYQGNKPDIGAWESPFTAN